MSDVYNPQCPSYQNAVYSDSPISTVAPTINFNLGDEVVLVIDEKGLTYRGELAADAGECYAMLTEFLNRAKEYKL